jgi:type IV fimbrial biogenesis protein FimT
MLTRAHHRGFTLVELMIGVVLLAIVLAIGGPSFATWLQNTQIRNMSEAMQNGIHLARAEAVRRNAQVRFQLVDSLTSSCALSTSGPNWIVSMDSAVGDCASTNMADAAAPAAPRVVQSRLASDGSPNAVVGANQSSIVFNGLGRVTPTPASDITIDVSNPNGGACAAASGPMRCLRIVVGAGGQIRMCDPRWSATPASGVGNSEGC